MTRHKYIIRDGHRLVKPKSNDPIHLDRYEVLFCNFLLFWVRNSVSFLIEHNSFIKTFFNFENNKLSLVFVCKQTR